MSQSSSDLPAISPSAERFLRAQGIVPALLRAIPGDASTRRYWRTPCGQVLAQVPDSAELLPFLRVQRRFTAAALPVPQIVAVSLRHGLLLQEDIGTCDLKAALDAGESADAVFTAVFPILQGLAMAARKHHFRPPLPAYDAERLGQELALFPDWYLRRHLALAPAAIPWHPLGELSRQLVAAAQSQPQVWVHRDFHARNLLLRPAGVVVMIDFQDAVLGPWTYDLASLLWDRYWDWGRERRNGWIEAYRQRLGALGVAVPEAEIFRDQVEAVALQRNLKILGIFCRLAYRDGKGEYLDFLSRFWGYVEDLLAGQADWRPYLPLFQAWSPCARR